MKIDCVQGEMTLDKEVLVDQLLKSFLSTGVHLINGIAHSVKQTQHTVPTVSILYKTHLL